MSAAPKLPIRVLPWRDLPGTILFFGGAAVVGWLAVAAFDWWVGWLFMAFGVGFGVPAVGADLFGMALRIDADGIRTWKRGRSRTIAWSEVRDIEAGDWEGPLELRVLVRDRMGVETWLDITPTGGPGVYRLRDWMLEVARRSGAPLAR